MDLARPERFELPTTKFVAWYSIQLSYGRVYSVLSPPSVVRFLFGILPDLVVDGAAGDET